MATLRIPFPGKSEPVTVSLSGQRITIGRSPDNTIQIADRTLSARHAELISDNGHYRLRDTDSTNGVFVNGAQVTDYHLTEPCKISFGTVECVFVAADQPEDAAVETLPTRAELDAIRRENHELAGQLTATREELEILRRAGSGVEGGVSREEFDRLVAERAELTERDIRREQEIQRLQQELALLQRDRENLQRALQSQNSAAENIATAEPPAPAPAPVTESPAPEAASEPVPAVPEPAAPAPAAPAAPLQPFRPKAAPAIAGSPGKLSVPPPGAPSLKPVARPAVPAPGAAPAPRVVAKPAPGGAGPLSPAVAAAGGLKPRVVAVPKATPKATGAGGTQKISV